MELFGAALFVIGSVLFGLSLHMKDSALAYKAGCAVWIPGCVFYSISISLDVRVHGVSTSSLLQCLCMLSFTAGCALPLVDGAHLESYHVDKANALFVLGAAVLFVDAVRVEAQTARSDPGYLACFLQLIASFAFVLAGTLGGYCTDQDCMSVGTWFWLVGSVVYCFVSARNLYHTKARHDRKNGPSSFYLASGGSFPFRPTATATSRPQGR
jgi:hypothetical protein